MSAEVALELTHLEWSPACLLAQWVSDGNSGLTRLGSVRAAVERCDREATASTEHKPAPGYQCRLDVRDRIDPWVGRISWRRAWQPTPVFSHGESHGQRSLVGSYKVHYNLSLTIHPLSYL